MKYLRYPDSPFFGAISQGMLFLETETSAVYEISGSINDMSFPLVLRYAPPGLVHCATSLPVEAYYQSPPCWVRVAEDRGRNLDHEASGSITEDWTTPLREALALVHEAAEGLDWDTTVRDPECLAGLLCAVELTIKEVLERASYK